MGKIAVDVILLPPKEVMEKVIKINRKLIEQGNDEILLDTENCIPHLSLSMGVIDEAHLHKLNNVLKEVSKEFLPLKLTMDRIDVSTTPDNQKISSFSLQKDESLKKLHESIMDKSKDLFIDETPVESVVSPPQANNLTISWIKNYRRTSAFDNFNPHITLGFGSANWNESPMSSEYGELGIAHLGNYCTCRKIIAKV